MKIRFPKREEIGGINDYQGPDVIIKAERWENPFEIAKIIVERALNLSSNRVNQLINVLKKRGKTEEAYLRLAISKETGAISISTTYWLNSLRNLGFAEAFQSLEQTVYSLNQQDQEEATFSETKEVISELSKGASGIIMRI